MKKCIGYGMIVPLIFGLGVLLGCQEQNETDIVKKARLTGQENIELKKLIKEKDREIQNQKKLLAECNRDLVKGQEEATDTNAKMLEIASKAATEAEDLRAQNEILKSRIQELESKIPKP